MLEVLLSVAALVATQPNTTSAVRPGDFKIITGLSPDTASCNSAASQRVQFGDALQQSSSMLGKCVLVRGHLYGGAMFASATNANLAHARPADGRKEGRIGLYGLSSDRVLKAGPYVVVGKLQDCAKFFADENAMALGYCHTHDGPFLIVSELRPNR